MSLCSMRKFAEHLTNQLFKSQEYYKQQADFRYADGKKTVRKTQHVNMLRDLQKYVETCVDTSDTEGHLSAQEISPWPNFKLPGRPLC